MCIRDRLRTSRVFSSDAWTTYRRSIGGCPTSVSYTHLYWPIASVSAVQRHVRSWMKSGSARRALETMRMTLSVSLPLSIDALRKVQSSSQRRWSGGWAGTTVDPLGRRGPQDSPNPTISFPRKAPSEKCARARPKLMATTTEAISVALKRSP